jgi:hypothetical protein
MFTFLIVQRGYCGRDHMVVILADKVTSKAQEKIDMQNKVNFI